VKVVQEQVQVMEYSQFDRYFGEAADSIGELDAKLAQVEAELAKEEEEKKDKYELLEEYSNSYLYEPECTLPFYGCCFCYSCQTRMSEAVLEELFKDLSISFSSVLRNAIKSLDRKVYSNMHKSHPSKNGSSQRNLPLLKSDGPRPIPTHISRPAHNIPSPLLTVPAQYRVKRKRDDTDQDGLPRKRRSLSPSMLNDSRFSVYEATNLTTTPITGKRKRPSTGAEGEEEPVKKKRSYVRRQPPAAEDIKKPKRAYKRKQQCSVSPALPALPALPASASVESTSTISTDPAEWTPEMKKQIMDSMAVVV
jgi:hypothetical protein